MSTAAVPDSAKPAEAPRSPWLVSAPVDLLIGCGAWTIPILLLTRVLDTSGVVAVSALFYFLTIFCNNPHYMATIYRAYGTPRDFQKYKLFTLYLTAMIVLTGVIVHFAPVLIPILFTVYITWSPWHYTAQNYGIGMMFVRRAGANPTALVRRATYFSYVASYLMWFLMVHSAFSENPYIVSLGISPGIAAIGGVICTLVFLGGATTACVSLVSQHGAGAMAPYLTLFSTQLFWFVLPIVLHGMNFNDATPIYFSTGALAFMHCTQYLWITQYYAWRERKADSPAFGWSTVRYYGLMVLGGIALFLPGPWLMSRVFRFNLVDSYIIFVSLVNIHHFMLDGAIWKLRDGRIAQFLLNAKNAAKSTAAGVLMVPTFWRWLTSPAFPARMLRYSVVFLLVAVAAVDQAQYYYTKEGTANAELAGALNPYDSRVWQAKAKRLLDAGDRAGAREVLRRALEANGLNPATRRMMSSLLLEDGDLDSALKSYEALDSMVYPDLPTLVNVGVLSIRRGDYAIARDKLETALAADPSRQDARLNLAEVLFELHEFAEAKKHYAEYLNGIKDTGGPADLHQILGITQRLGISLLKSGDPQQGLAFLEDAAKVAEAKGEPQIAADCYREIAATLRENKQFADAVRAYRKAITIADAAKLKDHPVYLYEYAALLLEGRGMKEEALVLLDAAHAGLEEKRSPLAEIAGQEIEKLTQSMGEDATLKTRAASREVTTRALNFPVEEGTPSK